LFIYSLAEVSLFKIFIGVGVVILPLVSVKFFVIAVWFILIITGIG